MWTSYLFKRIRKKGYMMVGYTFVKELGVVTAIVLERLLTEYNHAMKNQLFYDGAYFSLDLKMLQFHLGIPEHELVESINKLSELGLIECICYKGHEEYTFVRVFEDEIIDFEKTADIEKGYKLWDYGLYGLQSRVEELYED